MNKVRRAEIGKLVEEIDAVIAVVDTIDFDDEIAVGDFDFEPITAEIAEFVQTAEDIRDEEQEYYDNMPSGLQGGEKGETSQAAISEMESGIDALNLIDTEEDADAISENLTDAREFFSAAANG